MLSIQQRLTYFGFRQDIPPVVIPNIEEYVH